MIDVIYPEITAPRFGQFEVRLQVHDTPIHIGPLRSFVLTLKIFNRLMDYMLDERPRFVLSKEQELDYQLHLSQLPLETRLNIEMKILAACYASLRYMAEQYKLKSLEFSALQEASTRNHNTNSELRFRVHNDAIVSSRALVERIVEALPVVGADDHSRNRYRAGGFALR
jgi:hypothetical protein